MRVSLRWIAEIVDLAGVSPDRVASILTARGLTVDSREVTPNGDTVLDLDVPANRPDCLGHFGIAREIAAALGVPPRPRAGSPEGSGRPAAELLRVSVEAPELCPRYTARVVRGVVVGPSPEWVVERLEACGLRSVNNVVDTSNLVLLELGHPIHTFDLARLEGPAVVVRAARPGERLVSLDGIERILQPDDLVIADAQRPVALAGIVGGVESEIRPSTRDVLIESASFAPRAVRATARRLGVVTDASFRFERGVDPQGTPEAQSMAVRLLAQLCGGTPAPGSIDVVSGPSNPPSLRLRRERIARLLGYEPSSGEILRSLRALGLDAEETGLRYSVTVPSWRADLEREEDLVEEVARHLGYDRIPSAVLSRVAPPAVCPVPSEEEPTRSLLASIGFLEACNYAMIGGGEDVAFVPSGAPPGIELANPISETLGSLRRSLIPALLRSAALNLRRGNRDVRLFEVGRVFLASGAGLPDEPLRAGVAWTGACRPPHWSEPRRDVDFHDVAGVVDAVISALRPGLGVRREPKAPPGFHPGRSATWRADGFEGDLAWAGEVHPDVARQVDLPATVFLAEIELTRLSTVAQLPIRLGTLPRVPAVIRDLSLVLPAGTSFERLLAVFREVKSPSPSSFEALDRYEGPSVPQGGFSLTVRVILQPTEVTLTDAETEAYRSALVAAAERELGARLRG